MEGKIRRRRRRKVSPPLASYIILPFDDDEVGSRHRLTAVEQINPLEITNVI